MQSNSRPVILARLIEKDGKMTLENQITKFEIDGQYSEVVKELYYMANGTITLAELCAVFADSDIQGFINVIESYYIAFDVMNMGMAGHHFCNYPDTHKPVLSNQQIAVLQQPAVEEKSKQYAISQLADTVDILRQTCRTMDASQMSSDQFESIVLSSYGITTVHGEYISRSVPSAGAIHPLNQYFFVLNVDGHEAGIYKLSNKANILHKIVGSPSVILGSAMFGDEWKNSSLVHLVTFDIARSVKKYSSRAYRFALLEAGHSAQNAMRKATELNVGSWEYGGYHDHVLEEALNLNTSNSGVATIVFYGGKLD